MDNWDFLIDREKLNLIKANCSEKQIKKIDKRINRIFRGVSKDSLSLIELLKRVDSSIEPEEEYNIGSREVVIITHPKQLNNMKSHIRAEGVIGFDTEQRPTFKRGEKQKPISIIQFATREKAYIIQMLKLGNIKQIGEILSDRSIIKVGFGLKNDSKQLLKLFGSRPENLLDLSQDIKNRLKSRTPIGVKRAVTIFLNTRIRKSKNASVSNWERHSLTPSQVRYATEDATAPLDIYYELERYPFLEKDRADG